VQGFGPTAGDIWAELIKKYHDILITLILIAAHTFKTSRAVKCSDVFLAVYLQTMFYVFENNSVKLKTKPEFISGTENVLCLQKAKSFSSISSKMNLILK